MMKNSKYTYVKRRKHWGYCTLHGNVIPMTSGTIIAYDYYDAEIGRYYFRSRQERMKEMDRAQKSLKGLSYFTLQFNH